MNVVAVVTEVWNPLSILLALLSGGALGYLVLGRYAADPAYASGTATPLSVGVLTSVLTAAVGLVFFSVQILATYLADDPDWTRAASRLTVWVIYSAAIGTSVALRLKLHNDHKHVEARSRAVKETNGS